MRETRLAARVLGVPTSSSDVEDVAALAEKRLNDFLADRDIGADDIVSLAVTQVIGSAYEMDDAGAAGDRWRTDPGVLVTVLYKDRGRR